MAECLGVWRVGGACVERGLMSVSECLGWG